MDNLLFETYDRKIATLKTRLEAKRFKVSVVDNSEKLRELIKEIIPKNASVGLGGSKTLEETGVLEQLYGMDIALVDRYKEGISKDERDDLLRRSLVSEYFVTIVIIFT